MSIPPEKRPDDLFSFARNNPRDTIAYFLLIIGIILLFSSGYFFWGGLMIGLVVGFYFGQELMDLFKNSNEIAERIGFVKLLVLAALALTFFVAAPGVYIGAAIALGVKQLAYPDDKPLK